MPPKKKMPEKQPSKDIRSFFGKNTQEGPEVPKGTQPGGAAANQNGAGCQVRVKEEDGMGGHYHVFRVKFGYSDSKEYLVGCRQPCTVLEAIKLSGKYEEMIKCADENILIQVGKEDKKTIVATHFPCSCLKEDEFLIISSSSEKIEKTQGQHNQIIQPRDKYSVFYVDTQGGLHTKTKELFRSSAVKKFKYLCVYGEKGISVEEAVKRDGRFIDNLGKFQLSHNDDAKRAILCKQCVEILDQKEYKICLPLNKGKGEKEGENPGTPNKSHHVLEKKRLAEVLEQNGTSVKRAVEKSGNDNIEEIYEILCEQFPKLKKWMEERFPGDSYQEELTLRKENFGKVQQSFSEVHRVRKLLKLGESVCKVIVWDVCQGTGFVLFDNLILTNAHLFDKHVNKDKLQVDTDVYALFNYDNPEPDMNYDSFSCETTFIDFDAELDYAILELQPEGQNNKKPTKPVKVPPGLLKKVGPVPPNGEACIIGHPEGGLKKMDPICIIQKDKREQAVADHLQPYRNNWFTFQSIVDVLKHQGIDKIMIGGQTADQVVTYNTFMYHGSSGSPVFDASGKVCGLHSAGYVVEKLKMNVIEFAHPLLSIFERFVSNLKKNGHEKLLEKVKEEAKGNVHLEDVLEQVEPMDID